MNSSRPNGQSKLLNAANLRARQFAKSERGGFTLFTVVILIWMIVIGGMSVDFMRHEILRADLQNALDRGVLAATNLSGKLTGSAIKDGVSVDLTEQQVAERIVNEYVSTRNIQDDLTTVQVVLNANGINDRTVVATADSLLPTIFFRMVGFDRMNVVVGAGAEQFIPKKTEISVVLDISGSMHLNTTTDEGVELPKIELLKDAAQAFVSTVLSGSTENVLISIIPFTARVRIPSDIASLYQGYVTHHDFHDCFDHNAFDFNSTALPMGPTNVYQQPAHYRQGKQQYTNNFFVFDCPFVGSFVQNEGTDDEVTVNVNNALLPYSNDKTVLETYIEGLQHEFWTQAQIGMKHGVSLLDPAAEPIITYKRNLPEEDPNHLSDDFIGYPHAWNDGEARKFIVLMTDGANTNMPSVLPEQYAYDLETATFFNERNSSWNENHTNHRLFFEEGTAPANTDMQAICTAMKQRILERPDPTDDGLRIFTIGFELSGNPAALAELEDCARPFGAEPDSEVPTFYEAEGTQIETVFQAIADEIVNLKLTN